jgi:hypothetical protein
MDSDQKYFDLVAKELAARNLNPGIWARALAESDGDEAKARAAYIRFRAQELKREDPANNWFWERPLSIWEGILAVIGAVVLFVYLAKIGFFR